MPACVLLRNLHETLVIKTKWVRSITDADSRNGGCSPCEITKIFYSPDKNADANFRLAARAHFNATITACYYGNILYICGMTILQNFSFHCISLLC